MQRMFVWFFAFFLVLGTGIEQAEAKRLGGGKSSGVHSRQAAPANNQSTLTQPGKTQTAGAAGAPAAKSKMAGLLGPLAGLAVGGLLAAMIFGEGFEGFQILDFLLIAAVLFIVFKLIMRKKQQQATAAAGAGAYQKQAHGQQQPFNTDLMGGGSASTAPSMGQPAPDWFNEASFVERAKGHFVHLQKAWDEGDLSELQDFVTPEMYNILAEERRSLTEEPNTEVVNLNARLGHISQQGSLVEASIVFSGQIRENSTVPTDFAETWHMVRDMRVENANWYLQGIEQNS